MQSVVRLLTALALCFGLAPAAIAQSYPERPIRVITPYTAGSAGDNIMRLLAPKMEEQLGQKLIIEPKPGAAGNIGTLEVVRSQPDGYTVLVTSTNNFVINQFTMKQDFDPFDTLSPIAKIADIPLVIFAHPSLPANNFPELLAYARANPGKLNFGTPGAGSVAHLMWERIKADAGIDMTHIPFRGSPQGVAAVLANDIPLFTVGLPAGEVHVKAGTLKALAVTSEARLPGLPSVQTLTEAGVRGAQTNWWAMAVPKGTPAAVMKRLDDALAFALNDPKITERYATLGMNIPAETPEQFVNGLRKEAEFWSDAAKKANIKIE